MANQNLWLAIFLLIASMNRTGFQKMDPLSRFNQTTRKKQTFSQRIINSENLFPFPANPALATIQEVSPAK
jgi:hypothetical protein